MSEEEVPAKIQKSDSMGSAGEYEEEDMNFAEKLTAVVGVLFVEKYEYTVDGLYYGGALIRDWAVGAKDSVLGSCGYMPNEDQN